jgi:hypothetical protein
MAPILADVAIERASDEGAPDATIVCECWIQPSDTLKLKQAASRVRRVAMGTLPTTPRASRGPSQHGARRRRQEGQRKPMSRVTGYR